MKTLLAAIGLCWLLGAAFLMLREPEPERDPFDGFGNLDPEGERNIRVICTWHAGRGQPISRDCVERQAAAYSKYQKLRPYYGRYSDGYQVLKSCGNGAYHAGYTDYVHLLNCAEGRLAQQDAARADRASLVR